MGHGHVCHARATVLSIALVIDNWSTDIGTKYLYCRHIQQVLMKEGHDYCDTHLGLQKALNYQVVRKNSGNSLVFFVKNYFIV